MKLTCLLHGHVWKRIANSHVLFGWYYISPQYECVMCGKRANLEADQVKREVKPKD